MKPTASPPRFPFREHRNMAQVMADEEMRAFLRRPRAEKRMTLEQWRKRA